MTKTKKKCLSGTTQAASDPAHTTACRRAVFLSQSRNIFAIILHPTNYYAAFSIPVQISCFQNEAAREESSMTFCTAEGIIALESLRSVSAPLLQAPPPPILLTQIQTEYNRICNTISAYSRDYIPKALALNSSSFCFSCKYFFPYICRVQSPTNALFYLKKDTLKFTLKYT